MWPFVNQASTLFFDVVLWPVQWLSGGWQAFYLGIPGAVLALLCLVGVLCPPALAAGDTAPAEGLLPLREAVGAPGTVRAEDQAAWLLERARAPAGVALPGPIEDMRLTLSGLTGEAGRQESLWTEVRRDQKLQEAVSQLEARLGTTPPVYQVRELEPWSRIPERRHALVQLSP